MDFFNIPIIASAISIVVSWALFAIFCSIVQEAFAQIKAERGRFMKRYILQQLYDRASGINWGALVYMHGSVDLLSRSADKPTSDIPPTTFANALIESVATSHAVKMRAAEVTDVRYNNPVLRDFAIAMKVLPHSDVTTFLRQALNSAELNVAGAANEDDKESIVYQNLVKNVEEWHNGLMGRVGLWYQKQTRVRLFLLGLLISVLLNVDSIQLFRHYMANPASRDAVTKYYEEHGNEIYDSYIKLKADSAQTGIVTDSVSLQLKLLQGKMNILDSMLKEEEIPIGWKYVKPKQASMGQFWFYLLKILGFVLSGLAASFGAPFWYEVLKKAYTIKK